MHPIRPAVDLLVPIKPLSSAKSRLRGAADHGFGDATAHAALVLALAHDTVSAAGRARLVRRVVALTSDPVVAERLRAEGVPVLHDGGPPGLNRALRDGSDLLQRDDPDAAVGALPADLPALRPAELDAAIDGALRAFAQEAERAFVADLERTGTTFLITAPGTPLHPMFGDASARRHRASGAYPLVGDWPGLRRDVDTPADLCRAATIGLGQHTSGVLAPLVTCGFRDRFHPDVD